MVGTDNATEEVAMELIALLLLILCIVFIARFFWSGTLAAIRTRSETAAVASAKAASNSRPRGASKKKRRTGRVSDVALPLAAGTVIAAASDDDGAARSGAAGLGISDGGSTDWITDPTLSMMPGNIYHESQASPGCCTG